MTGMMPKPGEPIVDREGRVTLSWRNYLARLGSARSADDLWVAIKEIRQQLSQAGGGSSAAIIGVNGVQTLGQLSDGLVRIQLAGDEPLPSPRQVYGIREDQSRGFMSFADMVSVDGGLAKSLNYGPFAFRGELASPDALPVAAVAGDAYVIQGDLWVGANEGRPGDPQWENAGPASPSPVLSLADVTPSVGGTLQKTQFDAKGRRSHEGAATTTDLPEGTNLYFTDERADARVAVHVALPDPHPQYTTAAEAAAAAPIQALVAGSNITINTTDPARPVISASGGGGGSSGGVLPMVNGETPPVLMYGGNQLIYARVE